MQTNPYEHLKTLYTYNGVRGVFERKGYGVYNGQNRKRKIEKEKIFERKKSKNENQKFQKENLVILE